MIEYNIFQTLQFIFFVLHDLGGSYEGGGKLWKLKFSFLENISMHQIKLEVTNIFIWQKRNVGSRVQPLKK